MGYCLVYVGQKYENSERLHQALETAAAKGNNITKDVQSETSGWEWFGTNTSPTPSLRTSQDLAQMEASITKVQDPDATFDILLPSNYKLIFSDVTDGSEMLAYSADGSGAQPDIQIQVWPTPGGADGADFCELGIQAALQGDLSRYTDVTQSPILVLGATNATLETATKPSMTNIETLYACSDSHTYIVTADNLGSPKMPISADASSLDHVLHTLQICNHNCAN